MERRIVRRLGSWRGFLGAATIGTIVLVAPAAPARQAKDGKPGASPPPRSLTCVLDRIGESTASSPILDSKPPAPIGLDLDRLPPESTAADGGERVWRLDPAIARGTDGRPVPPRLTVAGGAPPDGVTIVALPMLDEVLFKDRDDFAECRRAGDAQGNRFVVFTDAAEKSFDVESPAWPTRFVLSARIHGTKDEAVAAGGAAPVVTVLANGEKLGQVELQPLLEDHAFPLPIGPAKVTITLQVANATPLRGRIAALRAYAIEATDGRDRLRVRAPAGVRGLAVAYESAPPPAVQTLFAEEDDGSALHERTGEFALLPGRAGVVMNEAQQLEVVIDGARIAASDEGSQQLLFDLDAAQLGTRSVTLRSKAGLKGTIWLVEPRSLYMALNDPLTSLQKPVPFVRGLDSPPGQPLARHMMLLGDTRRALLAPVGSEVTIPVKVEEGDVLEYVIGGAFLSDQELPRSNPTFEIALLTPDGGKHTLDAGSVRKRRRMRWEQRSAALPRGFHGEGKLLFRTMATGNAPFASSDGLLAFGEPTLVHATGSKRPNLLICLIDTLRADHCTPWGYSRETTPSIAELASQGIRFENAFSQAPWTRPSVASLFTGLLHTYHNASKTTGLAPQILTLAECMHDAGYATAGFISNAHVHGSSLNFEQGFSHFEAIEKNKRRDDSRAAEVNESAVEWLQEHPGQPFFLYVHTIDPHAPYDPPAQTLGTWSKGYSGPISPRKTSARALTNLAEKGLIAPADLQHVLDLYDEEILNNDRELGRLFAELKKLGVWDDTVVVVLSDHGEEFYEHQGFGHGVSLWQELLHVPVVIKPDRHDGDAIGRQVAERVNVIDLMPTLLERVGLKDAAHVMGTSVASALAGGEMPELPVIAEEWPDKRTLIQGDFKWIYYGPGLKQKPPRNWLFNLKDDPGEQHDLYETMPEVAMRMKAALAHLIDRYETDGFHPVQGLQEQLSQRDIADLRRNGYADAGEEQQQGSKAGASPTPDEERPEDAPDDEDQRDDGN